MTAAPLEPGRPAEESLDASLGLAAVAALAGVTVTSCARLVASGAFAAGDVAGIRRWREQDRVERRAALAEFAQGIGKEVFY